MRISDWSSDVCSSDLLEDETERGRLKQVLDELQQRLAPDFGVIARTAADGVDAQALEADLMFLLRLWDDIVAQARSAPAGALVHGDLPLSMRIQIGRAHVFTPVTNAHLVCRLMLDKKKTK